MRSLHLRRAAIAAAAFALVSVPLVSPATAAVPCPSASSRATVGASVTALRETCSQAQFDRLFATLRIGPLPRNVALHGQARPLGPPNPAATSAMGLVFTGKNFHRGWLINPFAGTEVLPANVFVARSIRDGRAVMRIDYSRSGLGFGHDELRMLPNGVWLGHAYLNNVRQVNFWMWR
ncbi:hypothetical protein GOARA_012_00440 [Gordonia araii NBRC 100433]|uniref:Uncharacterized protein n=1 Tax=Gordonia araii NBRC 100433 TaxID=1073574 RepID=G7GY19_9ACTN|nr:hypothetical protein [Gordonia araii]NNG98105.1 hypothetical protein [Gordonia araii NBRC 100433]GAB08494.1 hypothetical protein GOARA_012_00440 [Gordonia araii NBRC 100433]